MFKYNFYNRLIINYFNYLKFFSKFVHRIRMYILKRTKLIQTANACAG